MQFKLRAASWSIELTLILEGDEGYDGDESWREVADSVSDLIAAGMKQRLLSLGLWGIDQPRPEILRCTERAGSYVWRVVPASGIYRRSNPQAMSALQALSDEVRATLLALGLSER